MGAVWPRAGEAALQREPLLQSSRAQEPILFLGRVQQVIE